MATSQAVSSPLTHPSYSGLGRRLAAYLVDAVLALAVLLMVVIVMRLLAAVGLWTPAFASQGLAPEEAWKALEFGKFFVVLAYFIAQGLIYLILFEASPWQATFGKRLLNIYVTDNDGRRISVAGSFGRSFAKMGFGMFGGSLISMASIAATANKNALHDHVSNTLVLRGRPQPGGTLELWRIAVAFGLSFTWIFATFLATM
jgi:uncharacterized RDD family membrane protein YckC